MYLYLAGIIVVYGEKLDRFKPKVYAITFVWCDFLSLLLQAIGDALASTANIDTRGSGGTNIMIAWKVASLLLFILLSADFALSVRYCSKKPAFTELH